MIHDVKFDTKNVSILQISSQKLSTSSEYDYVLDALIIMLGGSKFEYNSEMIKMLINDVKFNTKDFHIFQNSSQEPWMSSKYYCLFDELLFILGSYNLWYKLWMTYYYYSWCQILHQRWLNSPYLQSGTINVLQVWLCTWYTLFMPWG